MTHIAYDSLKEPQLRQTRWRDIWRIPFCDIQSKQYSNTILLLSQADIRVIIVICFFSILFSIISIRMTILAISNPQSVQNLSIPDTPTTQIRPDIIDRNGHVLATNLQVNSLYARPDDMVAPLHAAKQLVNIFPDLNQDSLYKNFTGSSKFCILQVPSYL